MASLGQIQEPFTGTTTPTGWTLTQLGSATATQDSTGCSINLPATTSSSTDGDMNFTATNDLTGSFGRLNVTGVSGAGATHTDNIFRVRQNSTNYYTMFYEAGTLFFSKVVASAQTNIASVTFNATNHAWWQLRHKGASVYAETSTDGVNWVNPFAVGTSNADPTAITITAVDVLIGAICFGVDTNPSPFKFRYFNYPLPGTTTSTSSTSVSSTSTSVSTTSSSTSSTSTSISSTSTSFTTISTSLSMSITTNSTSSTSSSISSTSSSSTSSSTSISSTSSSISSTSVSSTSISSTSSSTSVSSTSSSFSSTSSSVSSTSASISSTSASSTSSSSSTSTTAIPLNLDYTYQDTAPSTVIQQFFVRSLSSWVCPVGVTSVLAECWGGGGGGAGLQLASGFGGVGGGGGAYSNKTITVVPGTSYTVTVGTGGAGGGNDVTGGTGNDSWFSTSGTVLAKGGIGGQPNTGGGTGGAAASGIGTVTTSGGNSSTTSSLNGAGGGGSGGSLGSGGNASTNTAGNMGPVTGGAGGAGGATAAGSPGKAVGGGGGGSGASGANGGDGAGGMVQLTYTTVGLPTASSDDIDIDNSKNIQNVAVDDGDYFVQYGSEDAIQEYKKRWINNTDAPKFTWKGRTTYDTRISPFLIQIYNVNSATWETICVQNKVPPDTDFSLSDSQSTNISNYYDSNNIVTFRTYQQVL